MSCGDPAGPHLVRADNRLDNSDRTPRVVWLDRGRSKQRHHLRDRPADRTIGIHSRQSFLPGDLRLQPGYLARASWRYAVRPCV